MDDATLTELEAEYLFMESEAKDTLALLDEGEYNTDRPAEELIEELIEVVFYLNRRLREVEKHLLLATASKGE